MNSELRILMYYPSTLRQNRGTPLRCRNLVKHLSNSSEITVALVSGDQTHLSNDEIGNCRHYLNSPEVSITEHLVDVIRDFQPQIVYGHTHNAVSILTKTNRGHRSYSTVVDLHGDYAYELYEQYHYPYYRRVLSYMKQRWRDKRLLPQIDAFTVVSEALFQRIKRYKRPTYLLWGGVDFTQFLSCNDNQQYKTSDSINVTYAGNFRPYQGVDVLIEAGKQLIQAGQPFQFTFIGNVEPFPDVKSKIDSFLHGHAVLLGEVPYTEIPIYLSSADILVVPRVITQTGLYGFPSKLPEYMASGKPIVVTDVGEHPRVIQHERTGIIIPPGNPTALRDALLKLKEPNLRQQLGTNARAYAESHLSWQHLVKGLIQFFRTLV